MTSSNNPGSWFRLDLGNGVAALAPTRKIQEAFIAIMVVSGAPRPERALFSRYDLAADNVEIYFTPSVSDLAVSFGAYPCSRPALNEYSMGLLCGDAGSLAFHFPEHPIHQR